MVVKKLAHWIPGKLHVSKSGGADRTSQELGSSPADSARLHQQLANPHQPGRFEARGPRTWPRSAAARCGPAGPVHGLSLSVEPTAAAAWLGPGDSRSSDSSGSNVFSDSSDSRPPPPWRPWSRLPCGLRVAVQSDCQDLGRRARVGEMAETAERRADGAALEIARCRVAKCRAGEQEARSSTGCGDSAGPGAPLSINNDLCKLR